MIGSRLHLVLCVLSLFLPCSCGSSSQTAPPAQTGPSAAAEQRRLPPPQPSLLEHVPEGMIGAVLLRQNALRLLERWLASAPEMTIDLRSYLRSAVGVDLTAVRGFVIFLGGLSDSAPVGLLVLLDPEAVAAARLLQPSAGNYQGVALYALDNDVLACMLPAGLVIGSPRGVALAIDCAQGRVPALGAKDPLAAMLQVDTAGTQVLVAVQLGAVPELPPLVRQFGIEGLALTIDENQLVSAYAAGPPARLLAARAALTSAIEQTLSTMELRMEQAKRGDEVALAVSSIIGYHQLKALLREAEPKIAGGYLVSQYQIPELTSGMGMASMAGILAAVAIPSFVKFLRRSKAVEAQESLGKIGAGAKAYFEAEQYDARGRRLPPQFPPGKSDWTPAAGCCDGGSSKCAPSKAWDKQPWRALSFGLADPHYYQYRYQSAGEGRQATFSAEARGDLDCDGSYSSFKITGRVDGRGQVVIEGPIISDELE